MLGFRLQLPHVVNNFTAHRPVMLPLKVLLSTDSHLYVTILIPRLCPGNEDRMLSIEAFASGAKMESSDQCKTDQWIR